MVGSRRKPQFSDPVDASGLRGDGSAKPGRSTTPWARAAQQPLVIAVKVRAAPMEYFFLPFVPPLVVRHNV